MKESGLDFVCVSSGGVTAEMRTPTTPGYNVPIAEQIRRETGIATRAVGLIATPRQAEAIVAEGKADMIALGRAMLEDPHWAWMAAKELGARCRAAEAISARRAEAVAGCARIATTRRRRHQFHRASLDLPR